MKRDLTSNVSSSTHDLRLAESQVRNVNSGVGPACYRVEIDVDGDTLPVGVHVLAPDRESAYNKLAVAVRRLGCSMECADRLNFIEE